MTDDRPVSASVPRVSRGTKYLYAVGRISEGVKGRAFEFFLFFYYVQVLGLSGSLAGLAVGVALLFDAITDPLAGSVSDGMTGRLGRRHPMMYASILPLGLFFYLLFVPPDGLGQYALFGWLCVFSVLTRTAMTLFQVPYLSLGAELTSNYTERTGIVAIRSVFGALGSVGALLLGLNLFLAPTPEFPNGQLNGAAYPPFALAMSLIMMLTVLICARGTQHLVPHLPQASGGQGRIGLSRMFRELREAMGNGAFRSLFIGMMFLYIVLGTHAALSLHMSTYYWELSQAQISSFVVSGGIGYLAGLMVARRFHVRFDKKRAFVVGLAALGIFGAIGPGLREISLFPANDSVLLLPTLQLLVFLTAFAGAVAGVSGGSMMADVADSHELSSGRRQEGIFFGAAAFAGKAASAFGHMIAGFAIDIIGFPRHVEPGTVAPEMLTELGLFYGPIMAIGMVVGIVYFLRYDLDQHRHAEILATLAARRKAAGE